MTKIFAGLKVLDFTWAAAGPIVTKQLSDNGATVVKVESSRHPDSVRLGGPFKDDRPGLNRSGFFADFNSSKLGVAVNTNHPRALEVLEPLVRWADIVADSFRPGVMERWGLGPDQLRLINPSVISFSSSLYGADGPWSQHPGFGAQGAALVGLHGLTGWPDRPPATPKGAYTDSVSPRYGGALLMAALIHRQKTGEGQHIDLSQIEATLNFLTPQLLAYQQTGEIPERAGNHHPHAQLHGVFACAGDDRWIAIEAWTEETWSACASVLAAAEVSKITPDFLPRAGKGREQWVEGRTKGQDAWDLADALRSAGVPAGVVIKGSDMLDEPVLQERGHFWYLDHAEMGRLAYSGPAYRFERTPSQLTKAAPLLGADTDAVLGEMLGFDDRRVAELRDAGVLQ
jgi:benzylsuccinate CoA-transferase BbsF subunit